MPMIQTQSWTRVQWTWGWPGGGRCNRTAASCNGGDAEQNVRRKGDSESPGSAAGASPSWLPGIPKIGWV